MRKRILSIGMSLLLALTFVPTAAAPVLAGDEEFSIELAEPEIIEEKTNNEDETSNNELEIVMQQAPSLYSASIDSSTYTSLQEAINAVSDSETKTIVLTDDETLTGSSLTISGTKNIILDLAGHKLTSSLGTAIHVSGGKLTVNDTGPTNGGIEVSGEAFRVNGNGELIINSGVNVTSTGDCAIYIFGAEGAKLTTYGNLHSDSSNYATIQTHGNSHTVEVQILGGTVKASRNSAIYFAGGKSLAIKNAKVTTANPSDIEGCSTVEIRDGILTIEDAEITYSGAHDYACNSNGNGSTTIGAGLAIAQHTTQQQITATISGESTVISGKVGLSVANPQANTSENISVTVSGGTFTGETAAVSSEHTSTAVTSSDNRISHFISGGTFSGNIDSSYISASAAAAEVTSGSTNTTKTAVGETAIKKAASDATSGDVIEVTQGSVNIENTAATVKAKEGATVNVAKVGTNYYSSLAEAVNSASAGSTIELLCDTNGAGIFLAASAAKTLTIDLKNHTFTCSGPAVGSTGTQNQALHLEKGNKITLKNGKITSTANSGVLMLVQNYADLTLENVELDGTNLPGTKAYTLSINNGTVSIGNGTTITAKEGSYAFDVCVTNYYPDGAQVKVADSATINGDVQYDVWGSIPAANKATLTINGGTFNGSFVVDTELKTAAEEKICITGGSFKDDTGNKLKVDDSKILAKGEEDTLYTLKDAVIVTFNTDDGTPSTIDRQKIEKGTNATKPSDPTKEGCVFLGWYADSATTAFDFTAPVSENTSLTAKWVTPATVPTINTQPAANTSIAAGSSASLSIEATIPESHTGTYQWYSNSTAKISEGTEISGATDKTYSTGNLSAGTYYYYCVVTVTRTDNQETATATSDVATVTVTSPTPVTPPTPAHTHSLTKVEAKAATCTEDGNTEYYKCTCGKFYSDAEAKTEITDKTSVVIKALGHKLTEVKAKEATCTEDGNIAYWSCETCGKYFSDAEGKTEITDKASVVLKANGHELTAVAAVPHTCTTDGNIAYWTCSKCKKMFSDAEGRTEVTDVIDKAAHTPGEAVRENVVEATYTAEGSYDEVVYCSVCGAEISRETKTVAKLARTSIAKAKVTGIKSMKYTGKKLRQNAIKVVLNGKTLVKGTDYKVTYKNRVKVGTATVKITGINAYKGKITKTFKITKAANPVKIKTASKTYKRSALTKAKTFKIGTSKAKGKVTYTVLAKAKKAGIKVTKKGTVTVPKNCKAGTYKIKVRAAGNANYKAKTLYVTIKVTK